MKSQVSQLFIVCGFCVVLLNLSFCTWSCVCVFIFVQSKSFHWVTHSDLLCASVRFKLKKKSKTTEFCELGKINSKVQKKSVKWIQNKFGFWFIHNLCYNFQVYVFSKANHSHKLLNTPTASVEAIVCNAVN